MTTDRNSIFLDISYSSFYRATLVALIIVTYVKSIDEPSHTGTPNAPGLRSS